MKRIDWNLLILSAAEGEPLSPVQLQKTLFFLQKTFPGALDQGYDFQPYNYGPFDCQVYNDAELLESQGLSQITQTAHGWKQFAATLAGLARAKSLEPTADPRALDYAKRVVKWAKGLAFPDLVRAIYQAYPETRANSIFKD